MITDLEKTFFDTFELTYESCTDNFWNPCKFEECNKCPHREERYPQMTSDILLDLICILSSNPICILFESMLSGIKEVELLKNSILLTCIANRDTIKQQVQALFKEYEWWFE